MLDTEECAGKCRHSKHYHVIKVIGEPGKLACAKVDCSCMEYVPQWLKPAEVIR